jgi:hypothetical protein
VLWTFFLLDICSKGISNSTNSKTVFLLIFSALVWNSISVKDKPFLFLYIIKFCTTITYNALRIAEGGDDVSYIITTGLAAFGNTVLADVADDQRQRAVVKEK